MTLAGGPPGALASRQHVTVDHERAGRQLQLISDVLAMASENAVEVWLRGGWAMDFFLGRVTRDHADVDWFAWTDDALVIRAALLARWLTNWVWTRLRTVRTGTSSSSGWQPAARGTS